MEGQADEVRWGRKSASERADGVDSWKQGEEETDADGAGLCSIQSCVPAR